jgi:hypothetical protein
MEINFSILYLIIFKLTKGKTIMEPIEIIVIIACVLIVGGVLGNYIYRKVKKLPTGECASCRKTKSGISLVDEYHKAYCQTKKCKK